MQTISFWIVLLVFLGGVGVAVQGPWASMMTQRMGRWESSLIIHLGGAILSALLLLLARNNALSQWQTVPKYALLGGAFGVFIIFAVSYSIPRIGATSTITILVIAQLVTGLVLDHFGLFELPRYPINLYRIVGCVVLGIGAWLVTR
jgi:transporter family-2 protein